MNIGITFSKVLESERSSKTAVPVNQEPVLVNNASGKTVGMCFGDGVTQLKDLPLIGMDSSRYVYNFQSAAKEPFKAYANLLVLAIEIETGATITVKRRDAGTTAVTVGSQLSKYEIIDIEATSAGLIRIDFVKL